MFDKTIRACFALAALILALAVWRHADRFEYRDGGIVFDRATADIWAANDGKVYKVNLLKGTVDLQATRIDPKLLPPTIPK